MHKESYESKNIITHVKHATREELKKQSTCSLLEFGFTISKTSHRRPSKVTQ